MSYQETLDYLYNSAPLFQNIGAGAYKEGLTTTEVFDAHFDHPHRRYATIHVGGTNGKGSTSHTLAAILQSAGYRVGLYTSPHLVDFRERIRVNGTPISEQRVVDFVAEERDFFEPLHPSFFELTTALAFQYFAEEQVDIAVIEVGLGGRLDCTNIICPLLSVITNISLDHTQFLGDTLAKIAGEKAGIIKPETPVVVGQVLPETRPVFEAKAESVYAPLIFAEEEGRVMECEDLPDGRRRYLTSDFGRIESALGGACQVKNTATILSAIAHLPQDIRRRITPEVVARGFAEVNELTGLMGRWQVLDTAPLVVCDTGHNVDAWHYLAPQLEALPCHHLHIVFGACADKDVSHILQLLPSKAHYYFAKASVERALPADVLQKKAAQYGLSGESYATVEEAYLTARSLLSTEDALFIGGSSFVVADFLAFLEKSRSDLS